VKYALAMPVLLPQLPYFSSQLFVKRSLVLRIKPYKPILAYEDDTLVTATLSRHFWVSVGDSKEKWGTGKLRAVLYVGLLSSSCLTILINLEVRVCGLITVCLASI
jgi:hypothetical protein